MAGGLPDPTHACYRPRPFLLLGEAGRKARVQALVNCLIPEWIELVACRLAAAVALPRIEPATALAPLRYMLIQGFFLVQGFFMAITFLRNGIPAGPVSEGSWP